ncbi:MAG: hypothetical protein ACR2HO_09640 [Rubrobacteraceae bacterium]
MTNSGVKGMIAAGIETFAGRARMMMLALGAATIACVVVMLVGVPGAQVREADASHVAYSSISGKLTKMPQGTSVAGGAVYLWRWNGSSWVDLGKKATSNQYGYYTISNVPSGYYYAVRGYKTYASCYTGMAIYDGYSQDLDLRNPASSRTVANVPLYFKQYFYC